MNKSAKEMFEELGYSKEEYELKIVYRSDYQSISFTMIPHEVLFSNEDIRDYIAGITMQELKAINKMVSELGWNNE